MNSHCFTSVWAVAVGVMLGLGAYGCSHDEETPFPPVRFDLCEVLTAADGSVKAFRFDDGTTLLPANALPHLRPDTIYRAMVGYQINREDKASVHQLTQVLSPMMRHYAPESLHTDAVKPISLWLSPRYLNLRVAIPRSARRSHYLGFHRLGWRDNANASRTLEVQLYHDARGDRPDFLDEVLLSCPLYPYADALRAGQDSVAILLQTPKGSSQTVWLYPKAL